MSYELNQQQISDLLTRHPEYQQLIQHALATNTWPNGNPVCSVAASTWFPNLFPGSPTAIGYNVQDEDYGNITLACDTSGVIHYNADSPVLASVMNAGPYVSPTNPTPSGPGCPGWSNIGSVNDFLACVGDLGTTLKWGVIAYIGYLV